MRIFNQMTETHRVLDLARLVAGLTGAEIDLVDNPRKEADENDLVVENRRLLDLGLEPDHALGGPAAGGHRDGAALRRPGDLAKIPCRSLWRPAEARGGTR